MQRILLIAVVLLSSTSASQAAPAPVYLWYEAEWFDGVKGSFAYWTGTAKPTGTWGVAGPGISPEWSAGTPARDAADARGRKRNRESGRFGEIDGFMAHADTPEEGVGARAILLRKRIVASPSRTA